MTSDPLTRATFGHALARALRRSPRDVFEALYPGDQITPRVFDRGGYVEKSDQPAATTTGSHFADDLVGLGVGDFLATLAPLSAAAALMRGPNALTIDVTGAVNALHLPLRSTAPAVPGWVPEGDPIQVRSDVLATVTLGPARKIGAMVVMTRELMKRGDAGRVFEVILREDAAKGLDAAVFSDADGNSAPIAGLLNGATVVAGSGDPLRDLAALAHAVSIGGSGQVVFVAGPAMAAALSVDTSIRATIRPSPAVAETRLIAVDPMSIVWGADSEPSLEISSEALLHMEDDPDPIGSAGSIAGGAVRSLFQTDAISTRLLLDIAFVKRRAAAVAVADNLDYVS